MDLDHPKKPLCILLIHGFGGSQREIAPLARLLEGEGLLCHMVQLAGHGGNRKAIENLPWQRWVDSAWEEYHRLSQSYRVVVVGFSMGGLVAAILNHRQSFAGMVFVNTPIYFWNLPKVVKNLFADFSKASRYYFVDSAGRVTLYTMLQFLGILSAARPYFKLVRSPALVVQADNDDSVWPQSAGYILRHIQGDKKMHRTKGGSHQVLLDEQECADIARKVVQFLQQNHL